MWVNVLVWVFGFITGAFSVIVLALAIYARDELKKVAHSKKKFDEERAVAAKNVQEAASIIDDFLRRRTTPANKSPLATPPPADASVQKRLRQAIDINSLQMKIDIRQGPEFALQYNELELEKLSILKTILADGFDPLITIQHNAGNQEMLLSAYVASMQKSLA